MSLNCLKLFWIFFLITRSNPAAIPPPYENLTSPHDYQHCMLDYLNDIGIISYIADHDESHYPSCTHFHSDLEITMKTMYKVLKYNLEDSSDNPHETECLLDVFKHTHFLEYNIIATTAMQLETNYDELERVLSISKGIFVYATIRCLITQKMLKDIFEDFSSKMKLTQIEYDCIRADVFERNLLDRVFIADFDEFFSEKFNETMTKFEKPSQHGEFDGQQIRAESELKAIKEFEGKESEGGEDRVGEKIKKSSEKLIESSELLQKSMDESKVKENYQKSSEKSKKSFEKSKNSREDQKLENNQKINQNLLDYENYPQISHDINPDTTETSSDNLQYSKQTQEITESNLEIFQDSTQLNQYTEIHQIPPMVKLSTSGPTLLFENQQTEPKKLIEKLKVEFESFDGEIHEKSEENLTEFPENKQHEKLVKISEFEVQKSSDNHSIIQTQSIEKHSEIQSNESEDQTTQKTVIELVKSEMKEPFEVDYEFPALSSLIKVVHTQRNDEIDHVTESFMDTSSPVEEVHPHLNDIAKDESEEELQLSSEEKYLKKRNATKYSSDRSKSTEKIENEPIILNRDSKKVFNEGKIEKKIREKSEEAQMKIADEKPQAVQSKLKNVFNSLKEAKVDKNLINTEFLTTSLINLIESSTLKTPMKYFDYDYEFTTISSQIISQEINEKLQSESGDENEKTTKNYDIEDVSVKESENLKTSVNSFLGDVVTTTDISMKTKSDEIISSESEESFTDKNLEMSIGENFDENVGKSEIIEEKSKENFEEKKVEENFLKNRQNSKDETQNFDINSHEENHSNSPENSNPTAIFGNYYNLTLATDFGDYNENPADVQAIKSEMDKNPNQETNLSIDDYIDYDNVAAVQERERAVLDEKLQSSEESEESLEQNDGKILGHPTQISIQIPIKNRLTSSEKSSKFERLNKSLEKFSYQPQPDQFLPISDSNIKKRDLSQKSTECPSILASLTSRVKNYKLKSFSSDDNECMSSKISAQDVDDIFAFVVMKRTAKSGAQKDFRNRKMLNLLTSIVSKYVDCADLYGLVEMVGVPHDSSGE